MISFTEENYLKSIYHLQANIRGQAVSTNALAELTGTAAASVSDMLRKLSDKGYIHYKKYQGVSLTQTGEEIAVNVIRRHRLWEVFLVDKLGFGWDEIHDLAEELEHVRSEKLINKLELFLDSPKFDPHGDPIPDAQGVLPKRPSTPLSQLKQGDRAIILGVLEDNSSFLQHLDRIRFKLGLPLEVSEVSEFDKSVELKIEGMDKTTISYEVAKNILVKTLS